MILVLIIVNVQTNYVKAATTVYINEEARVPVTVNFSKPIAGFYHTSTGVSGAIGDPMSDKYVSSTTIVVAFTPKTLGKYTFSIDFDVADHEANDIPIKTKSVSVNVVNRPAPKSSNNYLASLSTNVGAIKFNKNTSNYTIIVNNNVTSVTIMANADDSKATVSGVGTKQLSVYSNNFPIRVTAENGTTRSYGINIVRRDGDGNVGALSKNNNLTSLHAEGCEINFDKNVLEYRCEVDSLRDNVVVVANAEDSKASVDISQPATLNIGNNEIHVRVTAENEDVKLYKIIIRRTSDVPLLNEMDLKKALESHAGDEIAMYDSGRLALDSLKLVQKHRKTLLVKKFDEHDNLVYLWRFEGKEIDALVDINTLIELDGEIKFKIDELTNYAQGVLLSFQYNPHLPQGTTVGVYVGDRFEDEQIVNIYYYDRVENNLELRFQNFLIKDEFIWLPLEHTSDYFVTPAFLDKHESSTENVWKYSTFGFGGLVIGLLIYLLYSHFGTLKSSKK